jgi:hypothetical protein
VQKQKLILISKDSNTFGKILDFSDLETLFGCKVVFVSSSEPAYLITVDERRFEIGDILGKDVQLASVSATQVVLKQAGELMVFALPGVDAN